MEEKLELVTLATAIEGKIYIIRGKKVMLDRDLASLYGVEVKRLKEQVNRNKSRFPDDFLMQLNHQELEVLRTQFATFKGTHGPKYLPYAFTQDGVAMLSSVLKSERAIQVNIQIMRTFSKIREYLNTHKELKEKIEALETKYDSQFKVVFEAIKQLINPPLPPKKQIGFRIEE